jgi:hypothetical protein
VDRTRVVVLLEQERGDEEAAQHEEEVDPEEAALGPAIVEGTEREHRPEVGEQHEGDGDGAEAVERRHSPETLDRVGHEVPATPAAQR